jgi:hypothetical protein
MIVPPEFVLGIYLRDRFLANRELEQGKLAYLFPFARFKGQLQAAWRFIVCSIRALSDIGSQIGEMID